VKVVVGLGNPGKAYDRTRHNVGFEVVEELADRYDAEFRRGWLAKAQQAKVRAAGAEVLLVKPQTFMNLSGSAVAAVLRKRQVEPADVIVVLDDVELPLGQIRIRKKGGAGGHKGLQSVIQSLGTEEFVRVRLGIGPRPAGEELVEHVLTRFSSAEWKEVQAAVLKAADAVVKVLEEGPERAMNEFN